MIGKKKSLLLAAAATLVLGLYGCGGGGGPQTGGSQPIPEDVDLSSVTTGFVAVAGMVQVAAGQSIDHGDIAFSCAAGGTDCEVVVEVDANGAITATSTAGAVTATNSADYAARITPMAIQITTQFSTTKADYYPLDARFTPSGDDPNCCWQMEVAESEIAPRDDVLAMPKESWAFRGHKSPPVVRFVRETTPEQRMTTVRAIDNINAWLPYARHITVGDDVDEADARAGLKGNDISVHFLVLDDFVGVGLYNRILIDPVAASTDVVIIQHELLHAIGNFLGGRTCHEINCLEREDSYLYLHIPVSRYPESELAYATPYNSEHGLSQIDGETIQAIYTREELWKDDGDSPDSNAFWVAWDWPEYDYPSDLSPWDDSVVRYSGRLENWPYESEPLKPTFGVDWRNGMARPWAVGTPPYHTFAESGLSGTATYNGELVGFTPTMDAVQGDSAINVNLATMTGNATFTALEYWSAGTTPGAHGGGALWNDGNLHYTLSLNGNYLRSTGGDEGYVSGRFIGAHHQGAVGILERPDLTGAFGAVRDE